MTAAQSATPEWRISFDRAAQVKAGLLGLAFLAVFYNSLLDLAHVWRNSQDWSHGPIIPLFSAYLVYASWDRVRTAPVRLCWVGLPILLGALALYQYTLWVVPAAYIRNVCLILTALGMIILLCGLPVMRHVWVPWIYLFFAIPLPAAVYFGLTDPLRRIAATACTGLLSMAPDLHIERIGSIIEYTYRGVSGTLGVVDACAGMRSTITLCALGVAISFLSERPVWQRIVMVLSCVPIAVFSNFVRVTVTCILHIFADPMYAKGTYHTALGLVTLLLAFVLFAALGRLLDNLFVEDDDTPATPAEAART